MTIAEFIAEYYDLESYLKLVEEEHGNKLKLSKIMIEIPIPLINDRVKIHESQLLKLIYGEEPDNIPSLKYIKSHGIKFKKYFEFCISIKVTTMVGSKVMIGKLSP